jgi:hypothetical protein
MFASIGQTTMDHLDNIEPRSRNQGDPVVSFDFSGEWVVMVLGVVCWDGTVEVEAVVRMHKSEFEEPERAL